MKKKGSLFLVRIQEIEISLYAWYMTHALTFVDPSRPATRPISKLQETQATGRYFQVRNSTFQFYNAIHIDSLNAASIREADV